MSTTPKAPAPPRWEDLWDTERLDAPLFGDDAVVEGKVARDVWLHEHRCEFVDWAECAVSSGSLADSSWYRPGWRDLKLTDVDLANSEITEGSLSRVVLDRCRMTGLVWSGSTLTDLVVTDGVVDLATLRDVTLQRVRFENCRMTGLDLSMSKLTDVSFVACDLSEAQFHQLKVNARVRFEGCELIGAKGLTALRGAVIQPADLFAFTGQLAAAMGIIIDRGDLDQ